MALQALRKSLHSIRVSPPSVEPDLAGAEGDFNDYMLFTIDEMPKVEVHIVPSNQPVGGMGEPGLPPIAPAIANAVFAATGKRIRKLPMRLA